MNTVLVVSYVYPPLGGPGTFRWLKLTRYLPAFGIRPVVLCADDPSYWCRDASLTAEIAVEADVVRHTKPRRPLYDAIRRRMMRNSLARYVSTMDNLVDFPDDKQGWARQAAERAAELVGRERVAAVITTSPPASAHWVGRAIKSRFGLPWVADFRDPWADGPLLMDDLPAWLRRRHAALERRVAQGADHCLFAHPAVERQFGERHGLAQGRTSTLFNGFDPADFASWPPASRPNGHIEIVHTGTFYANYNPSPLRRALESPEIRRQLPLDRLRVTFVGGTGGVRFDDVPGLNVRVLPRVSHAEALAFARDAHVLLCVFTRQTGAHNINGKLFEYMAAKRPILAIVPGEGDAAELVRRTRTGSVADPDDPAAIAAAMRTCIDLAEAGRAGQDRDEAEIAQYDRRRQAAQVAALLERLIARRSA